MRNFRKAALAGATAVAVAFGSTAVATAEETTEQTSTVEVPTRQIDADVDANDQDPGLSSKIADWDFLQFKDEDGNLKGVDGRALFGKKDGFSDQPIYAQVAYGATVFTAVSAIVGLIVGPLYNFIVHGDFQF